MSFEQFMSLALYHPQLGYYRRDRKRIGYGRTTDFFTASTSGPVFGELVVAACASLLGSDRLGDHTFVEVGAESKDGILAGVIHPFRAVRTLRVGEPLSIEGACVVFSNELFDAQPFRRFIFRAGGWRELGVALVESQLREVELLDADIPALLPKTAPESYVIDAPLAAAALARTIAAQPWKGLFLAFDYGKSWREIAEHQPSGTARAYYRHQQSNNLLARPGDQDLTCHICWDWISDALTQPGFEPPVLESQESFFIRRAVDFIAVISASDAGRFSQKKLSLMQLLHPGQLGQKFQVLHALRR